MPAKFKLGDPVKHPAAQDNSFPAGTGTVTAVTPDGKSFTYEVKCDTTGTVLPVHFKESDLKASK